MVKVAGEFNAHVGYRVGKENTINIGDKNWIHNGKEYMEAKVKRGNEHRKDLRVSTLIKADESIMG